MRRVDGPSILVAQESAVIVWDPVKKVQHFIRRAAFDTKSPDFGFLVPTPTVPQLPFAEVEEVVFQEIGRWTLPKTVEQSRWKLEPLLCFGFLPGAAPVGSAPGMAGVRVLHEQKVGGYEVNVLEADDAEELAQWIKKHGYSADPELYDWLKPYVEGGWKISAFKIMQDPKSGKLATTKAVRTSFKTDRPFFPYREPEKKNGKEVQKEARLSDGRTLSIVLVSSARMEGKLGAAPWNAKVPWADRLTDEQRKQIAKEGGIPADEIPADAWLTAFEDRSAPRPSKDDVYFEPSDNQTPVHPPDLIHYTDVWIPIDCTLFVIAALTLVVTLVVLKSRRRTQLPNSPP